MEPIRAVLEILEAIHRKNVEILEEQDEDSLQDNKDFLKLYEYYYISNLRIQNAIDILKVSNLSNSTK